VEGHDEIRYTCVLDRCRAEGVHLYRTEFELEQHLRGKVHKIHRPQLRSQRWLEAWLDEGRHTHVQAAKRQISSEPEETETEYDQELEFDDSELSELVTDPSPELRGIDTPSGRVSEEAAVQEDIEVIKLTGESMYGAIVTSTTDGTKGAVSS
jgi:hypothetical protein